MPLRALPSDEDALGTAVEEPVKEHKYLQVLTKESQQWKFHFSENPAKAPCVAPDRGFDDEGWGKIRVPSSWECEGHGQACYTNFQYPFKFTPPVVSPLMNHVGSYQTYVVVPASWQDRKVLLIFCRGLSWCVQDLRSAVRCARACVCVCVCVSVGLFLHLSPSLCVCVDVHTYEDVDRGIFTDLLHMCTHIRRHAPNTNSSE